MNTCQNLNRVEFSAAPKKKERIPIQIQVTVHFICANCVVLFTVSLDYQSANSQDTRIAFLQTFANKDLLFSSLILDPHNPQCIRNFKINILSIFLLPFLCCYKLLSAMLQCNVGNGGKNCQKSK